MGERVLVAMSGGVDSSACAALLLEQGYSVAGATMTLHGGAGEAAAAADAKAVCDTLGIEHELLDFRAEFERCVIAPFLSEYLAGRTPNPCMRCNRELKFGAFYAHAKSRDFSHIATGHYARALSGRIARPATAKKEQTYVFALVRAEVLPALLLPCGEFEKPEIRAKAERAGLEIAHKSDSQEICFIEDDDHARFIESRTAVAPSGDFVDENGAVLGRHRGIYRYTIGQRKGLGISFDSPRFVKKIIAAENKVVLAKPESLLSDTLFASELNFHQTLESGQQIFAQPRYNARPAAARIYLEDGGAKVVFAEKQRALTPGQVVAFYDGELLAGGGIINAAL